MAAETSILQSLELTRHPWARADAVRGIAVDVRRSVQGTLGLRYRVDGEIAGIRVPASRPPRRTDGLWQHTCFEAFVAVEDATEYHELNFAPSGEWAGYAFRAYREVTALHDEPLAPRIAMRVDSDRLELEAFVELDRLGRGLARAALRLGLAAVIEGRDGAFSYWSLYHPPGKPDFHHPDSRAVVLAPP